jgi:hypothetical protein
MPMVYAFLHGRRQLQLSKLNASVDPNPPAGFELDEKYQTWIYSEADTFSRGEPSVVYRRDANVIWLPSRSPAQPGENGHDNNVTYLKPALLGVTFFPTSRHNGWSSSI